MKRESARGEEAPGSGPVDDREPAPIDRSALAVITGGDPAVERRLLTVFRKANDADAAALKEALARQDIAAITRASHGMMGASRLVGAAVLADICATIAQAGHAGDWGTITANQNALARELDRVTAYIDTLLVTARSGSIKPEP